MLPQIASGEPATRNAITNKIQIMVQTAGVAMIIYDADGWRGELCRRGELCSCSISVPCRGEKPSAAPAVASCTRQRGQSMGCCCASLLGSPKVESECAGGAETKH